MAKRHEPDIPNRLPPLRLAFLVTVLLAGFSFLPRVIHNIRLAASFWVTAAILLVFIFFLRRQVARTGRVLR